VVYFPTSPKRCFCTTLQNRKTKITHTLNFYQVCHGFGRSVENWRCWAFLRWTRVKVNDNYYYWNVVLSQQMSAAIRHVVGDNFIFQQDSTPAHWARDTIELLQRETPNVVSPELWPPTVRIWTPLITRFGESCSSMRRRSTMSTNSSSDWLTFEAVCMKALSTLLSASTGESVVGLCRPRRVFAQKDDTTNICCFDTGMKLSIDSLYWMCFWSF